MRDKKVRQINAFLVGLQEAAGLSDTIYKNVRRNVKRQVSRSSKPVLEALLDVDINAIIKRAEWVTK